MRYAVYAVVIEDTEEAVETLSSAVATMDRLGGNYADLYAADDVLIDLPNDNWDTWNGEDDGE